MARYLFNDDPISVRAETSRMKHGRIDDHAKLELQFNHDKKALIESSWILGARPRTMKTIGTNCAAELDFVSQQLTVGNPGSVLQQDFAFEKPLKLELQAFISCIVEKKNPLITGADGIKALDIAEAALESSKKGKFITPKFHI